MERKEMIRNDAQFFFDKDRAVHITLESGRWLNGKIISIDENFLVLQEDRFGEIGVQFERIIDDGIVPKEIKKESEENDNS